MIKVGIAGAETPQAGELLRILANHPDVDIVQAYCAGRPGVKTSTLHHGLIGETETVTTDRLDASRLDVLFVCSHDHVSDTIIESRLEATPELNVIDVSDDRHTSPAAGGMVYGLSEIYRKTLVRGAREAVVPRSASSLALVALYPLARRLLLPGDIRIRMTFPADAVPEDIDATAADIAMHLGAAQQSFDGHVSITTDTLDPQEGNTMRMRTEIDTAVDLPHIRDSYEEVYDDHSFTFIISGTPDGREVESTHKCIIGLSKPEQGRLTVEAVADSRMRGGAAEAVHLMNLLCGLAERTGLALKANVL